MPKMALGTQVQGLVEKNLEREGGRAPVTLLWGPRAVAWVGLSSITQYRLCWVLGGVHKGIYIKYTEQCLEHIKKLSN